MKKLACLLLAGIISVSMLAGCGSEENAAQNSSASQSSAPQTAAQTNDSTPATVKFATWGISEAATKPVFEQIAASYKTLKPNTTIEYVGIPYGDIKQQTFVMAASGNAPDIIQTHTAWFSTYATSDIVEPLDELLGKEYIDDIIDSYKADYTYNGKLMGIPWAPSPYVLYYNKEIFKKAGLDPETPPKTYDEMLTMARAISKVKSDDGNKIYGFGEATDKLPINGLVALRNIYSFNGSVYDKDSKVNVNTPEVIETLKFYQTISNEGLSPSGAKLKDLRNLFSIGQLGMYMDGYYGKAVFRNLSGKGEAFDKVWGVALVPVNKTGKSVSIGEAHGLVISKDSKVKTQAADILKYITSKEMITQYHKSNDVLSARKSLSADPDLNDSDFAKVCVEQLNNYIQPLPANNPGMEQGYLEIATALQRVTVGKEDPAKVAQDLDAKLKGLLK